MTACDGPLPDWCTGWPDGAWAHCCALHDIAFTMQTGLIGANATLAACVARSGWPVMAAVMLAGVTLFGGFFYKRRKGRA